MSVSKRKPTPCAMVCAVSPAKKNPPKSSQKNLRGRRAGVT